MKKLAFSALVAFMLFTVINVFFVQNSKHIIVASSAANTYRRSDFVDYFIFKSISYQILMNDVVPGNSCDVRMTKDYVGSSVLKDKTISMLVSAYGEKNYDKDAILNLIRHFSNSCDINKVGDDEPFSPLFSAILFRHHALISTLLDLGARQDIVIHRPNKSIDGMSPIRFAMYLKTVPNNSMYENDYDEIIRLLKSKEEKQ